MLSDLAAGIQLTCLVCVGVRVLHVYQSQQYFVGLPDVTCFEFWKKYSQTFEMTAENKLNIPIFSQKLSEFTNHTSNLSALFIFSIQSQ